MPDDARGSVPGSAEGDARGSAERVILAALAGESFPEDLARAEESRSRIFKPYPFASYASLDRRVQVSRYRTWWKREVGTPYGLCGCGCGRPTTRQRISNSSRGLLAGEPAPFYGEHEKLFLLGFGDADADNDVADVVDPTRRCACGCGSITMTAHRTEHDDAGRIVEYDGLRRKYLNRAHRPPPALPDLTLTTPLAYPSGFTPDNAGTLAGILGEHGGLVFRSGRPGHLVVKSTDEFAVRDFMRLSGRGRVGEETIRTKDSLFTWSSRSSLEGANVLTNLWGHLDADARRAFTPLFTITGFPVPKLS